MATEATLSVEERLYRLLRYLDVDQAHFAGWTAQDWSGLVAKYPHVISSLTLVSSFERRLAEPVSAKLLVVTGDRGPVSETVRNAIRGVPGVRHVELSGLARAGNARVRRGMIQLAWRFLMFQKESALTLWYRGRTADSRRGTRKTMIVALARKLIIALWRFVTTGEPLEGVVLRPAS